MMKKLLIGLLFGLIILFSLIGYTQNSAKQSDELPSDTHNIGDIVIQKSE